MFCPWVDVSLLTVTPSSGQHTVTVRGWCIRRPANRSTSECGVLYRISRCRRTMRSCGSPGATRPGSPRLRRHACTPVQTRQMLQTWRTCFVRSMLLRLLGRLRQVSRASPASRLLALPPLPVKRRRQKQQIPMTHLRGRLSPGRVLGTRPYLRLRGQVGRQQTGRLCRRRPNRIRSQDPDGRVARRPMGRGQPAAS